MNLIAEISMYPLQDGYIAAIDAFLAELNVQNAVEVRTDRMSTQLYGDYAEVMTLLGDAMANSHTLHGKASFVVKFIPGADRSINGYE